MRVITLSRKPLIGTVAGNSLIYGTGGMNIDACRIGITKDVPASVSHTAGSVFLGSLDGSLRHESGLEGGHNPKIGRWPSNLILQHLSGCECQGVTQVKSNGHYPASRPAGSEISGPSGHVGQEGLSEAYTIGETVAAWNCEIDCPVAELDLQSGVSNGGASRFFYQTQRQQQDDANMKIPSDLVEYLRTLISPPPKWGQAIYIPDLATADWEAITTWVDNSVVGLIARGTPTEAQAKELMRVLAPGAHLCLIAPDEQPTGHTGACRIEDAGMEIRDTILLVDEPGKLHYVPKANRKERDAGCNKLKSKSGAEAVKRKEGTAGLDSPRAGSGRTASRVKNFHPTVKAKLLMERLLRDVPRDTGPVLDPFLGSGSTGLACLETGHDFIGIELSPEYLKIADARTRHWWDQAIRDDGGAVIQSDLKQESEPETKVEIGLADLFGGEDE